MPIRSFLLLGALILTFHVFALGFELGKTKEELKLKYSVSMPDHKTGCVTIVFKLQDEGRLGPLDSVDLGIPANDGSGRHDLVVSIKLMGDGKEKIGRVHILRSLAERATVVLKTHHMDGKMTPRTWYYHSIPIKKHLPKQKSGG
ncbi:MAG: hypothetical protein CMO80_17990 [Verrucomicrobiales bacterium]|nr:hypothetical protein [Verrucomicrobiales bacterium]|tara:strand:- start:5284 stop:5718 length:435 start_codon:yes stop_codon:yes gene_type:complete